MLDTLNVTYFLTVIGNKMLTSLDRTTFLCLTSITAFPAVVSTLIAVSEIIVCLRLPVCSLLPADF